MVSFFCILEGHEYFSTLCRKRSWTVSFLFETPRNQTVRAWHWISSSRNHCCPSQTAADPINSWNTGSNTFSLNINTHTSQVASNHWIPHKASLYVHESLHTIIKICISYNCRASFLTDTKLSYPSPQGLTWNEQKFCNVFPLISQSSEV